MFTKNKETPTFSDLAKEVEVPSKGFRDRDNKFQYANYIATMAVYERLGELIDLLKAKS